MSTHDIEIGGLTHAVGKALGIPTIRSASVNDNFRDITEVTVTFIATKEQMKAIGEAMAQGRQEPADK